MKAKELLTKLKACQEALEWAGEKTINEAWETCDRGDWMLWFYKAMYPDNLKELTLAKAHCANTVRHLMEDQRSIDAVDAAIEFGEGKITREELLKYNYSAYAADPSDDAAYAAAYAYSASAYAAASASAEKQNKKETADICRKYLTIDFNKE